MNLGKLGCIWVGVIRYCPVYYKLWRNKTWGRGGGFISNNEKNNILKKLPVTNNFKRFDKWLKKRFAPKNL